MEFVKCLDLFPQHVYPYIVHLHPHISHLPNILKAQSCKISVTSREATDEPGRKLLWRKKIYAQCCLLVLASLRTTTHWNAESSSLATTKMDLRDKHSSGNLMSVLGFNSKLLSKNGYHDSDRPVNIADINSVAIRCYLIDSSYINGSLTDIVHSFSPTVPPGYLMNAQPEILVTCPSTGNR